MGKTNDTTSVPEIITREISDFSFAWQKETKYDVEDADKDFTPAEYRNAISAIKQNAYMLGMAAGYKLAVDGPKEP